MKTEEVTVVFDTHTGKVQVETGGFKGSACYDITKQLNLGVKESDKKKKEFHDTVPIIERIKRT